MHYAFRIYIEMYECLSKSIYEGMYAYVYMNGLYVYVGYNTRKISCSPYGWPFPLTLHPPSSPELSQETQKVMQFQLAQKII